MLDDETGTVKRRGAIRAKGEQVLVWYYKDDFAQWVARPDIFKKVRWATEGTEGLADQGIFIKFLLNIDLFYRLWYLYVIVMKMEE